MDQVRPFGDKRVLAFCAFCGAAPTTRDHCPSKFLLDEPFPENLPVVQSCSDCNSKFSIDEEYLGCLLACVLAGSTELDAIARPKIRAALERNPRLRDRLASACSTSGSSVQFAPEIDRINAVMTKLAQGHAVYELHEVVPRVPDTLVVKPLLLMTTSERLVFESPEPPVIWPEVGSRALQRAFRDGDGWLIVQPNTYRYHAMQGEGIEIRIVVGEYLAAYAQWRD